MKEVKIFNELDMSTRQILTIKEGFPGHSRWFEGLMLGTWNKQRRDHAEIVFFDFLVT